ncbi:MAG: hypothetical protein QOG87_1034 [Actinomycetota bacterium]|jgi:uncharacterized protein (TIGR03083 family)
MDLSQHELLEVGLDAVDVADSDLPDGMSDRILDAMSTRTAGTQWPSRSAFIRTAAELGQLLDTLTPDEWERQTAVAGSTVRDLVSHLVGVERYVHGQLGAGPRFDAPTRDHHYPVSGEAASDLATAATTELASAWWRELMRSIAACTDAGPDQPIVFHHLSGTVGGLLVIRTFELWTHDEDIRRATGRPANALDDTRLTLMSGVLMQLLAQGMALAGTTRSGRTARFELTGRGAGTFDVALAPDEVAGAPDIVVRTDAVELCRLAANRVAPTDLAVEVTGDRSLLEPILIGAGAFALD